MRAVHYLLAASPMIAAVRFFDVNWPFAAALAGMAVCATWALWFADREFDRRQREMREVERRIREEERRE